MNMTQHFHYAFAILFVAFVAIPLNTALAQSGTADEPRAGSAPPSPALATTSTAEPAPRPQEAAIATSSQATPRPIPTPTPAQTLATSVPVSEVELAPPPATTSTTSQSSSPIVVALAVFVALIAGLFGIRSLMKFNKKSDGKEEHKCDDIRSLLEQKKKELEAFLRDWPEDQLKKAATKEIVGALKQDERVKPIIDTAEKAKAHYDSLQNAIEMLQKKYDLCMLSLPLPESQSYRGVISEQSLTDKEILQQMKVQKNYQGGERVLNEVLVGEKQIQELGAYLHEGPWHAHFWRPGTDEGVVVFRDKIFKIKNSDTATWQEAIAHGISKGIPQERLDFTIPSE